MTDIAIRVDNLSKQSRIGSAQPVPYRTLFTTSLAQAAVGRDNAR